MVQQVDVRCDVCSCLSCPEISPFTPTFSYWEAWEIILNDNVDVDFDRSFYTDKASIDCPFKNTCGNLSQIGTMNFFLQNNDR